MKEPIRNKYVGHRYVPLLMGEWDKKKSYEGLSIVTNEGNSYTSKKRVPTGIDIFNEEYWVVTGNYNAQIEVYRKEVKKNSDELLVFNDELKKTSSVIGVNPSKFGALGDGVTNDTDSFIKANNYSKTINLEPNKVYRLQNFIPLENTTIYLNGSTIVRHDESFYKTSSASIIIKNKNIKIINGFIKGDLPKESTFTGGILIESGSVHLEKLDCSGFWSSIFSHEKSSIDPASYVSIVDCTLHENQHNTYLGNIDNLLIAHTHSFKSNRDGIKTYAECKNITITGCHLYKNGNKNLDQSQDGIDIYKAGDSCIITDNYIYDNDFNGIDIKRNEGNSSDGLFNQKIIIGNNEIFGNRSRGISIVGTDLVKPEKIIIHDNLIYDNSHNGIQCIGIEEFNIHDNFIYNNLLPGIRIEKSIKGGKVHDNIIYNNSSVGIHVLASAFKVDVTSNKIYAGGKPKTGIIHYSNGKCINNTIYEHTGSNIYGGLTSEGESIQNTLLNTPVGQASFLAKSYGYISQIGLTTNVTADYSIEISKRKLDGSFDTLFFSGNVSLTAFKTNFIDLSLLNDARRTIEKGQIIYVTITTLDETFKTGLVHFNFCN